ncbi:nitroreductase family protein [Thioflexithrix psekupsensis]|uniref:Nitroreductase n=1 Tax=Thioflexithrix psekupsensis TaxID=1570016 RepID=A0A251X9J4_9GAMM|nr:nitroreductase family protein [Thioflexithrix psekupsensis]OUD14641.1 nitroreductase [Thioflexithrix psekupsensis]
MLVKKAETAVAIHDLIAQRWSPRALDPNKFITLDQTTALLEAARWSPSCFGAEPWRYVLCDRQRSASAWRKALDCLAPANQVWAQHAPLFLIATAVNDFSHNQQPNRWAQYDTGAACENICLQAVALGLVAHQMGGFDPQQIKQAFELPDDVTVMSVIAVGYQASATALDEALREREEAPRQRKSLAEIAFDGHWRVPFTPK